MKDEPPHEQTLATRALVHVTRHAVKAPFRVLALTLVAIVALWVFASGLRVSGSFVELIPSESPTARRFHETLARKAGASATLVVMVESPDAAANQRYVDALKSRLDRLPADSAESVEVGPGAARDFFEKWRWLFADRGDLVLMECELDREIMEQEGTFLDLDDPCEEREGAGDRPNAPPAKPAATADGKAPAASLDPGATKPSDTKPESALERFEREVADRIEALDRYPTGYFRNAEGTLFSIMIRARGSGMGGFDDDALYDAVRAAAAELEPARFHPKLTVGYAGSIPNATAERNALIADVAVVSTVAGALILGSIILFFRSALVLLHIGLPVALGTGIAFAFARAHFGLLNSATSFLGSIIAGNGINFGIVYLARYREQRAKGLAIGDALEDAALTCKDATWLAALAAGGAYAALTVTTFRGFNQFGLMGALGMLACWLATFAITPASVAAWQRILAKTRPAPASHPNPFVARFVADVTTKNARFVLVLGAAISLVMAWPLKDYLQDPWEYDFSKLGSKRSQSGGAGAWSTKSNKVFQSRGSPLLLLAPEMNQVLELERALRQKDRELTGGTIIDRIETVYDRFGGTPENVEQKLALLGKIRRHIDRLMPRLRGHEREIAERWRPPETLRQLGEADLPEEVRRQFTEKSGRFGTPLYVYLNPKLSQSNGHNLLKIAGVLEGATLENGEPAPNASRAAVFATMIRSLERDGPLATVVALTVVVLIVISMTRSVGPALVVISSLLIGVLWTVGGSAWAGVRLNFLNFVALPITFGIGVDYAINFFERAKITGDVRTGVASVGGSVALCSLTTIFGYGSLLFADNRALVSFGRYAITGELSCSIAALLMVPAALYLGQLRRERLAAQANATPPESPSA